MPSILRIISVAATLAVAQAQGPGVIMSAQGTKGTPPSTGLMVSLTDANDANVINSTEINDNMTNECGRTLFLGNTDIGQAAEDLIAAKNKITSTTKGGAIQIKVNQGGPEGAGPYACDVDLTSNAGGASGQTLLPVNEIDGANGTISLSIRMPATLACTGGSTGNLCTVRCYNQKNLGGCFEVMQTDIKPAALKAATIKTAAPLQGQMSQTKISKEDLPAAMAALKDAPSEPQMGLFVADALLMKKTNYTRVAAGSAPPMDTTASTPSSTRAARNLKPRAMPSMNMSSTNMGNMNMGNTNKGTLNMTSMNMGLSFASPITSSSHLALAGLVFGVLMLA